MVKPLKKKIRCSDPATKGDLVDMGAILRREVKEDMSAMEYRTLEQMSLLLEQHRADIIGATKDDVTSLKTRVTRLERQAGFAAAA